MALTVIRAVPSDSPPIQTVSVDDVTLTRFSSEEVAEKLMASPSGSAKKRDRTGMCSSPDSRCRSGSVAVMPGGWFSTLASKLWNVSIPAGSVAVTVIVAAPGASAASVTRSSAAAAVATPGFEKRASNVSGSPSGSVKSRR